MYKSLIGDAQHLFEALLRDRRGGEDAGFGVEDGEIEFLVGKLRLAGEPQKIEVDPMPFSAVEIGQRFGTTDGAVHISIGGLKSAIDGAVCLHSTGETGEKRLGVIWFPSSNEYVEVIRGSE